MSTYFELRDLTTAIKTENVLEIIEDKKDYLTVRKPDVVLDQSVIKLLTELGAPPEYCVLFGITGRQRFNVWPHADIRYSESGWIKLPCGINWELNKSDTYFSWWDTKNATEVYPESIESDNHYVDIDGIDFKYKQQGVHYESRNNRDTRKFERIQVLKFESNTPYLVRTDIAHSVSYNTPNKQRVAISIRFPLDIIPTWQRAVEVFNPIIKQS